ncbi:MAG: isoprenylcysteine carboxylmethyltransferase family protein [Chloroflexi bacterium]|nr:MAG: isoprenylcysteine carboxylmethyltransferase family protein [Chloroflexota bacterium]
MTHAIFKLVYFIELVVITMTRRAALRRTRRLSPAVKHDSLLDRFLLYLSSLANLLPLVYVFTSWLDFANYDLPAWIGWLGSLIFAGSGALIWKTHKDLGRNWTPSLAFRDGHYLVTDGIFQYLRHPMYAANLLWGLAQMLMLHNWIAGFAYLVLIIPRTLMRIQNEERIMLEKFEYEYRRYMEKTEGLYPRLGR